MGMERMFDDMTVNDGEKEKLSVITEDTKVDEEIAKLWQKWSTDEDSDIFTVADLLEDMDGTPTPITPTPPSPTASTSSTTGTRRKKFTKKRTKKTNSTRANPVLSPSFIVDRTGFVLVSNNLPKNTVSSDSDTEAPKQATTTCRHGNIARTADFDIIARLSSNGKISKPLCKRKGEKTPTVKVLIRCNKDGKLVKIIGLPDTGATIDILKSSIAKENKMEIIPNDGSLRLVDAEGKPLEVEGLTYIDIQRSDGTWFNSPALVSPTLRDNLLLSHTSQKAIGILHPEWPEPFKARKAHQPRLEISPTLTSSRSGTAVRTLPPSPTPWPPTDRPSEIRDVCREFEDVILDELTPTDKIKAPPMGITLEPGYKPSFIKKRKQIPIHWWAAVNKEKEKLIREGIIKKFTDTPAFISAAKWVPKKDPDKFRLCVDLRKLNEASVKMSSVFPTSMEVWQNLKPESEYFYCLDAHSGYYQAEIEQSSRKYFTFLLDDGLYTFNRLPMGYTNSGHQFVQLVHQIFWDVDVQIEVDDFMVESPDVKTMAEKLRKLFQRARDRGVIFARRNLQEVNFAGLTISKGTCKPQAKK